MTVGCTIHLRSGEVEIAVTVGTKESAAPVSVSWRNPHHRDMHMHAVKHVIWLIWWVREHVSVWPLDVLKWYINHLAEEWQQQQKSKINTAYGSITIRCFIITSSSIICIIIIITLKWKVTTKTRLCKVHYKQFPWKSILALSWFPADTLSDYVFVQNYLQHGTVFLLQNMLSMKCSWICMNMMYPQSPRATYISHMHEWPCNKTDTFLRAITFCVWMIRSACTLALSTDDESESGGCWLHPGVSPPGDAVLQLDDESNSVLESGCMLSTKKKITA